MKVGYVQDGAANYENRQNFVVFKPRKITFSKLQKFRNDELSKLNSFLQNFTNKTKISKENIFPSQLPKIISRFITEENDLMYCNNICVLTYILGYEHKTTK